MSNRNIRLILAYDGTDFSGWQRQDRTRTVQGVLESALERIHKHHVTLTGSGRTDAGVHADGQVANFYSDIHSIPPDRYVPALNTLLPRDVRILRSEEATTDFHARFDAKWRTYRYRLICGRSAKPWELRYAPQLWRRPQLGLLNSYASRLVGEIDCSLFAAPRETSLSRHRYISQARFHTEGDALIFEISANAFLWKMVRSIVGTLLFLEDRGDDAGFLDELLSSKDHGRCGPSAPPQGLSLWKVEYYRH